MKAIILATKEEKAINTEVVSWGGIMSLSLIIPTYNERENLETLVRRLHHCLSPHNHEFIIVDDNSPDGTSKLARELSTEYPIRIITRKYKRGLASAIVDGFREATGEIVGVIDADLQHPPEVIGELIEQMSGFDIAIASRYVENGRLEGWSSFRRLVSKTAIFLSRPLTQVKDPLSGYFLAKANIVNDIKFDPIGYKVLLEVLVKGNYRQVKEVPYTFQVRVNGHSKLGFREYTNYLKLLFRLYQHKLTSSIG